MLMGEIITAVAYKLPIKLVIIKNNTLGQIKWEQMVFQGNPEYQCDLFPNDFVALAKAVGANGVRIDDSRTAGTKFDEALAMPGPVIIEAVVDQFTAMLPAKITADQALKFSEALAKGEPNRIKIALTAAKERIATASQWASASFARLKSSRPICMRRECLSAVFPAPGNGKFSTAICLRRSNRNSGVIRSLHYGLQEHPQTRVARVQFVVRS